MNLTRIVEADSQDEAIAASGLYVGQPATISALRASSAGRGKYLVWAEVEVVSENGSNHATTHEND